MDISIIMIGSNFYNQLDQSMESIANQSDVDDIDYELILVNAGTSDRGQTDSKIADWKRKIINFKPFDFLAIKHPGGLELGDYADLARNMATGTVAIYLPPFDIMAKNRVSTIFNLFNKIYNIGNHVIVSDYVKNNLVIDVSNVGNGGAYLQTRHRSTSFPAYYYPLDLNPLGGNVKVGDTFEVAGTATIAGNVGIGTDSPDTKLEVSGNLADIKVTDSTNGGTGVLGTTGTAGNSGSYIQLRDETGTVISQISGRVPGSLLTYLMVEIWNRNNNTFRKIRG